MAYDYNRITKQQKQAVWAVWACRGQASVSQELSEWFTNQATARIFGVGPTTIPRWADQGRLPYTRTVGGHRRFKRSTVEALSLSSLQTGG